MKETLPKTLDERKRAIELYCSSKKTRKENLEGIANTCRPLSIATSILQSTNGAIHLETWDFSMGPSWTAKSLSSDVESIILSSGYRKVEEPNELQVLARNFIEVDEQTSEIESSQFFLPTDQNRKFILRINQLFTQIEATAHRKATRKEKKEAKKRVLEQIREKIPDYHSALEILVDGHQVNPEAKQVVTFTVNVPAIAKRITSKEIKNLTTQTEDGDYEEPTKDEIEEFGISKTIPPSAIYLKPKRELPRNSSLLNPTAYEFLRQIPGSSQILIAIYQQKNQIIGSLLFSRKSRFDILRKFDTKVEQNILVKVLERARWDGLTKTDKYVPQIVPEDLTKSMTRILFPPIDDNQKEDAITQYLEQDPAVEEALDNLAKITNEFISLLLSWRIVRNSNDFD